MWLHQVGLLVLSWMYTSLHMLLSSRRGELCSLRMTAAPCFCLGFACVWSCDDLQVIEDLREECSKYGQVMKVVVPRPPIPQHAHALFNQQNYGKVSPVVKFVWCVCQPCLPTVLAN